MKKNKRKIKIKTKHPWGDCEIGTFSSPEKWQILIKNGFSQD